MRCVWFRMFRCDLCNVLSWHALVAQRRGGTHVIGGAGSLHPSIRSIPLFPCLKSILGCEVVKWKKWLLGLSRSALHHNPDPRSAPRLLPRRQGGPRYSSLASGTHYGHAKTRNRCGAGVEFGPALPASEMPLSLRRTAAALHAPLSPILFIREQKTIPENHPISPNGVVD